MSEQNRDGSAEPRPGARDVYEVLGVSSSVSPIVAQAIYWARISELREEERAGDESARERIDELSAALEIVMDHERRARYDRGEERSRTQRADDEANPGDGVETSSGRSGLRRQMRIAAATLAFAAALGISVLGATGEPLAGIAAIAVPPMLYLLALARPQRERLDPFRVLELAREAEPEEIDLAYVTLVSSGLSRLPSEPEHVVRELDRLDAAYAQAMGTFLGPSLRGRSVAAAQGAAWHAGHLSLRAMLLLARLSLRGVAWVLARVGGGVGWALRRRRHTPPRMLERATGAASRSADRLGRTARQAGAQATVRSRRRQQEEQEAGLVRGQVQDRLAAMEPGQSSLEQRLSATVHALAQESVGGDAEVRPARRYALALESAAGTRRIGVSDRPVRIGTGPEVDIVPPGTAAGDEPREYALIWASGNDLVLHASGRDEECRVNGEPVTWARLDDGDTIAVAGMVLAVQVVVSRRQQASAA